jgi:hypothetical protein
MQESANNQTPYPITPAPRGEANALLLAVECVSDSDMVHSRTALLRLTEPLLAVMSKQRRVAVKAAEAAKAEGVFIRALEAELDYKLLKMLLPDERLKAMRRELVESESACLVEMGDFDNSAYGERGWEDDEEDEEEEDLVRISHAPVTAQELPYPVAMDAWNATLRLYEGGFIIAFHSGKHMEEFETDFIRWGAVLASHTTEAETV